MWTLAQARTRAHAHRHTCMHLYAKNRFFLLPLPLPECITRPPHGMPTHIQVMPILQAQRHKHECVHDGILVWACVAKRISTRERFTACTLNCVAHSFQVHKSGQFPFPCHCFVGHSPPPELVHGPKSPLVKFWGVHMEWLIGCHQSRT